MSKLNDIADNVAFAAIMTGLVSLFAALVVGTLAVPAGVAFLLFSAGYWLIGL